MGKETSLRRPERCYEDVATSVATKPFDALATQRCYETLGRRVCLPQQRCDVRCDRPCDETLREPCDAHTCSNVM